MMLLHAIKTHWIALILSVVVGGIYASHHFFIPTFFPDTHNAIYAPIASGEYYDEMLVYGPRGHDAFLNFGTRGDFTLAEYPTSPALLPMLNPLLLGGIANIFRSMDAGLIASDILFPSLIFFMLYLLMQEAAGGLFVSLLFATVYIISPKFGIAFPPMSSTHIETLKQTIFPFFTKTEALYFSHFEEPKLTFLFLTFFVYALTRALKGQNRASIIMAGLSFGILFYTYLYDWATVVTSLGFLGCWYVATKDYRRLKIVVAITSLGLLVSSYYWINLFMLKSLPQSHDVIARLGGEFSHHFRFASVWKSYVRAGSLVVLLWIFTKDRTREITLVVSSMLLSYVVVVNEQVITGFNVQPDHWYRVQFLPIALGVTLLIAWVWRKWQGGLVNNGYVQILSFPRKRESGFFQEDTEGLDSRFRGNDREEAIIHQTWQGVIRQSCMVRMVGMGIIAYLFISFLAGQYVYAREYARNFFMPAAYREGFTFLNTTTKSGSVVATFSIKGNLDLELYTKNKIFLPFGLSTVAPEEEIWQRAMIMAKLWNIIPSEFAAMFREGGGANYLFGDQYGTHTFDANFFGYSWRIPNDVMIMRLKKYETMLYAKRPLIRAYQLDYVFVDKEQFPSWKEPRTSLPLLKKIFENERVVVFSVK